MHFKSTAQAVSFSDSIALQKAGMYVKHATRQTFTDTIVQSRQIHSNSYPDIQGDHICGSYIRPLRCYI